MENDERENADIVKEKALAEKKSSRRTARIYFERTTLLRLHVRLVSGTTMRRATCVVCMRARFNKTNNVNTGMYIRMTHSEYECT